MHAAAGQAQQHVARRHAARQQVAAFRRADRETGEVVIALGIQSGHLGRLAAHQRAAGFLAARCDAGDHRARLRDRQMTGREIVQEEQRLGALHHQIVDAHRHQIDANRIVQSGLDGQLQLGAHPVGGGNQDRVGEARRLRVEQGTEAAQPTQHAGAAGGPCQRLDRLHQRLARIDIDARLAVRQAIAAAIAAALVVLAGHARSLYAKPVIRSAWQRGKASRESGSATEKSFGKALDGNGATMPDGMPAGGSFARGALLTLPNVITFARLCAVPLAVWLVLRGSLVGAFTLFVAAAISDAIDGWLARRNGGGNSVGALLDPVADKALLVTMYVSLAAVNELPVWLAILVVFRDAVIVGGVVVLFLLGQ